MATKKKAAPKAPVQPIIFIATPMYGGACAGMFTRSVADLSSFCEQHGIALQYYFLFNESLITRARNSMAYDFIESEATHLMFIDADIAFNPADIPRMVAADKDIICGLYPKKEINWLQVTEAVKAGTPPDQLHLHTGAFVLNLAHGESSKTGNVNEPIEIANGGTGFMLIKRKVFDGLMDKVPSYTNDMYHAVDVVRKVKVIKEFFATSIDEESNRLLSEDYHFCKIARQAGFTVWCAPWANFSHTGTYSFSGTLPRSA